MIDSESADGVTMYSNQLGRHSLGRNAPIRHSFFPFRKLYVLFFFKNPAAVVV